MYKFFKIFFVFYFYIIPKKIKFRNIENINFRNVDFTNYKKIKVLIFKKNFIQNNKDQSIYNFDFLNFASKLGGKKGIEISKQNIFEWYKINSLKINKLWNNEFVANRIINLLYNFEYINSLSSNKDSNKLKKILKFHIRRFTIDYYFKKVDDISISELKAFILINIVSNKKNIIYEKQFTNIIRNQLDNFSIHKSYNLIDHSIFINDISEIINILLSYKYEVSEIFFITKLKMVAALSQYFHKDGSIALFNGTNNNYLKQIITVLKEEKNIRNLEYPNNTNGVYFFEDNNKKIFFDVTQPEKTTLSKKLSAGTLSIEFSSNKEKIITNCGALEKQGGNASYLRYSAAHSTIILKNTNVSEIRENEYHLKFPQLVDFKENISDEWIDFEGSHNGYLKKYKKIIKRKVFFKRNEDAIYGEDNIISALPKNQEIVFHIRFHLLPSINITETNKKQIMILKTKNNVIWTFKSNFELALEESIYVDFGDTTKTNQIVIKGITKLSRERIKWSLIKT